MKKLFFAGLAAVCLLSSCDKEVEVAQQGAIGFDPYINKSTKGIENDLTTASLKTFGVYGWQDGVAIFNDQVVNNNNGVCTYEPVQYWVDGSEYYFEAIAPRTAVGGGTITFEAKKGVKGSMEGDKQHWTDGGKLTFVNDGITDMLYAHNDYGTADVANIRKVGLEFYHLLSRVKFTFVNGFPSKVDGQGYYTIAVSDVKIADAYKNGVVTPAVNTQWAATENTLALDFTDVVTEEVLPEANEAVDHMYFIPFNGEATYTLSFKVLMTQYDANGNKIGEAKEFTHGDVKITSAMLAGNSYNFTATLDAENINPDQEMKPIEFEVTVDEWGDFTDLGTDIPAP